MNEALALAEFRDEPIDLLIASSGEVENVAPVLRERHPELSALSIVDQEEHGIFELRRSFTQTALLERVRLLLTRSDVQDDEDAVSHSSATPGVSQGIPRNNEASSDAQPEGSVSSSLDKLNSAIAASASKK